MKSLKEGLVFIVTLMSINLVSASFHYGFSSLDGLLSTFDSSTVFLTAIFLIAFVLIFWPLSKFFKENTLIPGIIAFALSFLLIFEVNRRGYDFTGFFYGIGISEGIFSLIIPLALIVGLIFSGFKYGWGITLASLGGFLIFITFTSIVYSKGTTFVLGAILLGIGIWLWMRGKNGGIETQSPSQTPTDYAQETRRLRERQNYEYYKNQQEQRERQQSQQRRNQERELRRQQSKQQKIIDRYARRYGKKAARKRFGT